MRHPFLPCIAFLFFFACTPSPKPDSGLPEAAVVLDAPKLVEAGPVEASVSDAAPETGDAAPMMAKPRMMKSGAPASRLVIWNQCADAIWVQQQNMPKGIPAVFKIGNGTSVAYDIPAQGLASTRFWAKTGCDATGNNCKMGQSSPPCPAKGCAPPVDSKLEATWGCLSPDPTKCASTPQGNKIDQTTWWNASAVDGYTLPYTITVSGGDGRAACVPVDCSGLSVAGCPTNDDLTTGGKFPQFANQDEHVKGGGGCYSTCGKLTYPTFGGDGVQPPSDPRAQMYCCPTPPVSSPQCQAGPVVKTQYVQAVHAMCKKSVYGYAYDDGVGLRNCSSDTNIVMTYGPNCL
jgi:hypothetical protein